MQLAFGRSTPQIVDAEDCVDFTDLGASRLGDTSYKRVESRYLN